MAQRVNAATFFTTQVDFEKAGDLLVYVDEEQVKWIEGRMKDKGYLPGTRMADAFNLLRSNDLIWSYVVNNYMLGKEPMPFDLLYWNADSTRMPAGVHSFYLRECYMANKLAQGKMVLDNVRIDLKKVKTPVYNLAAREDHIAPMNSNTATTPAPNIWKPSSRLVTPDLRNSKAIPPASIRLLNAETTISIICPIIG